MRFLSILLIASSVWAADPLIVTRKLGNDNVDVTAKLILDPEAMRAEIGSAIDPGNVVVRVEWWNKSGNPLHIAPSDFVLLSRKNGERADAIAPGQIAGGTALIVNRDTGRREFGALQNQPGFTGVAGVTKDKENDNQLLVALKAKELLDQIVESKDGKNKAEGLVYFSMDTKKLKAKDLSLLYAGAGGRLAIDFK